MHELFKNTFDSTAALLAINHRSHVSASVAIITVGMYSDIYGTYMNSVLQSHHKQHVGHVNGPGITGINCNMFPACFYEFLK